MRRRPIVVSAAIVLIGLAAVALLTHVDPSGRQTGGPLACDDCDRTATSILVRQGERASFGPVALSNNGTRPATLEGVRLLDVDPGFEFVGALVVEPDGTGLVGVDVGYPPDDPGGKTTPVAGYVVDPAQGPEDFVQVLIGATITGRGRYGARRIAVDYRVGIARYRAVFDDSLWLCTHRDVPEDGCTNPDL